MFISLLIQTGLRYIILRKITWINVKYVVRRSMYMGIFAKMPNFDKKFTILLNISLVYVKEISNIVRWQKAKSWFYNNNLCTFKMYIFHHIYFVQSRLLHNLIWNLWILQLLLQFNLHMIKEHYILYIWWLCIGLLTLYFQPCWNFFDNSLKLLYIV